VKRESPQGLARASAPAQLERVRRRRRLFAGLLIVLAVAAFAVGVIQAVGPETRTKASKPTAPLRLVAPGGSTLAELQPAQAARLARGEGKLPVPARRTVENETASVTYELDAAELRSRLGAGATGAVTVPERPVASRISTPVVQQRFRNNCETAALSMLLASQGEPQDQVALQEEIRHDGPLDPETGAGGEMVWGNPEKGFVGRVDGGGTAGGFGVYQDPVIELAGRWVEPVDLSGEPPASLYAKLLEGKPVFAWIGLQDGPYESWVDTEGEKVTVNYGEHTVLLVGIEGDRLLVNDPLDGQRKWWTKSEFETMYERLDRRAISVA
jgi:uncharacterized protein YvpB